jgi:hypothetical protein
MSDKNQRCLPPQQLPITGSMQKELYHLPAFPECAKVSLEPRVPFPTDAAAWQKGNWQAQYAL